MRIGILEDQARIGEMLSYACELAGHTASVYSSVTPFLADVLATYPSACTFDVLVVDFLLSEARSGAEVIHYVRNFYHDLPVVLISGKSQEEIEAAIQELPSVKVLQKPFKLQSLFDLINQRKASFLNTSSV